MRNRWLARGALAILLAGAGEVYAQTAPEAPIVRMRTAGQPDRQLKILRMSSYTDGESIAEVQDVQTGQTFTLPGKVVANLPKEAGATSAPAIVAPPRATLPSAQPQPVPPNPVKPVAKPVPPPDDQPQPKVTFIPPPPLETAPAPEPKVEPKAAVASAQALTSAPASKPSASLVWRPRLGETPPLAPTPLEPAKPDRWMPMKRFAPDALQSMAPANRTIVRGTHYTGHEEEPPAVRVIRPQIVEERGEIVPAAHRSLDTQIRQEIQGYVYDLGSALRPSVRENAAICLAESRYGSRQEVKTVLAKAAIADPAPSVRAVCIELLMKLGYHDPDYLAYLQSATTPGEVPTLVRTAAKEALAKLTPRGN